MGGATKAVLYGEVNPCGRLPESFPVQLEDNPSFLTYGGEGNTAVYNEGVFVGYRYYDRKKMPVLFPFGYGLSYTRFVYGNLRVSAESLRDTDTLTVSVDVTNVGKVAGKEVVQLYVADRESSVFRPVRELKGFEKIALRPGETKTVTFRLGKRAFAYWNTRLHDWFVETGVFGIEIGRSSRDIVLSHDVTVQGTVREKQTFDVNTIYMDLQNSPEAMKALAPLLEGAMSGTIAPEDASDAAAEAITDEMNQAMMRYMPMRSLASFSDGAVSYDQLSAIMEKLNDNQ